MAQSLTAQSMSKNLPDNVQVSNAGFMESFERRYPLSVLETLLSDHTTENNIVWADDEYAELGVGYFGDDEITVESITGLNSGVIKPRIAKEHERQSKRTRNHGEVFTPSWLCNKMNNFLDAEWFGREVVFNIEDGESWVTNTDEINFPKKTGHGWQAYVKSPRLEITCGEAPFICSRYDTSTGETLPVDTRIGFLDRKLRIVSERTQTYKSWLKWAYRVLKATYGYEYQGDNLVVARINVLETFAEHANNRWGTYPSEEEIEQAANIISWNIWQMNGLTYAVPSNDSEEEVQYKHFNVAQEKDDSQLELFDTTEYQGNETPKVTLCKIYDWDEDKHITFKSLASKKVTDMKKFYAIIGNPPYQDESTGDNKEYAPPLYHLFLDSAYNIADRVEMVHPARFLFDAGSTPKAWNEKMLSDPHLEVLDYEAKSNKFFTNTDIKGGVAITYRDSSKDFGAIGCFIAFDELRSIVNKVEKNFQESLSLIIYASESYRFTDLMHKEHPEAVNLLSKGHKYDFKTSVLETLNNIVFFDEPPARGNYVQILGLIKSKRASKWIKKSYVVGPSNFEAYKVFLPAANGSGALGEVLSTPLIGEPLIGHTQTYISIGCFKTKKEAENCLKYVESKFCRVMLGVLKVTQHNPAPKWKYVPLQNFTSKSDIDWSKSIPEIDKQLYKKYGLTKKEIDFIESHVQEMD